MGKKNKSQDNELKRVPPENEDEILRNADPSDSSEAMNEPGHGTVDDVDEAEQADGNAEDNIDATVVAIESVVPREEVLSANKGMPDQDAGTARDVSDLELAEESNAAEDDLDATIVDIDPTVSLEADESGTEGGIKTVDAGDAGDSVEFDPNATLEVFDSTPVSPSDHDHLHSAQKASGEHPDNDASEVDLTVKELEATVQLQEEVAESTEGRVESDSGDHDDSAEDFDKTIMEGDIDQTIVSGSEGDLAGEDSHPPASSMVRGGDGNSNRDRIQSTVRDAQEATYDGYDSNPSAQTVDSSVLESGDIGQTINPREFSDEEASAWSLAAQGEVPKAAQTVQSGAGRRRTWVDYQFSRLRERAVSTGKEKQNVDDDYRLVRKLGQGGMGDVYVARQGSLNRLLALKLIKPLDGERRAQLERLGKLESVEEERKQQFLSEAIVTGDLDHPNIVPIHDVAVTSDNELFYSMKRVVGTPWSKVIKKNSRDENLEILMKSCDAIGFAHERGVVHRDIKPENIMLGDFGVVMVMDWGLALPTSNYDKHDSIFATSGLGGTPAFMAPEMVTGPLEKIGPHSDIYLLGATLFMIITGSAPHKAKSVTECLKSVRRNTIRKASAAQQGELLDIAMRAMATKPEDRYPDVASFQNDIRAYREHAESISLTVRATEDLELGQQEATYAPLSRAAFRYEEALKSWADNQKAKQGLEKTKLVHARIASDKGDYEFGLSLLDGDKPEHLELIHDLESAIQLRDSHAARVAVLRKAALAMLAFILIFGSAALFYINATKNEAIAARNEAIKSQKAADDARKDEEKAKNDALESEKAAIAARKDEEKAKNEALESEKAAIAAKKMEEKAKNDALESEKAAIAARKDEEKAKNDALKSEKAAIAAKKMEEKAKDDAVVAQQQAEEQRARAEYEEYISKIALAKARLERNEADGAREILLDLQANVNSAKRTQGWEWRWLWRQANESIALGDIDSPVIDLAMDLEGKTGAVACADGYVQLIRLGMQSKPVERLALSAEVLGDERATSVALTLDGKLLAVGTVDGQVIVVAGIDDLASKPRVICSIKGHKRRVTDMRFDDDGILWTASDDQTVRSWKQAPDGSLGELVVGWHFLPVQQIDICNQSGKVLLAAVVGDGRSGKVVVWEKIQGNDGAVLKLLGRMLDHPVPPTAVAFDSTGQRVASGDLAGNVLVWNTNEIAQKGVEDYRRSIELAVKQTQRVSGIGGIATPPSAVEVGVALKDSELDLGRRLVSADSNLNRSISSAKAHGDAVATIRFSDNGESLLTSSDDYTVKLWNMKTGTIRQTLKGHGGWVVGAEFVAGEDDLVISASDDTTVRLWNPETYVGAFKSQDLGNTGDSVFETSDSREEIWSATFASDGKQIVIARGDHKAEVIRVDEDSLAFRQVSELALDEGTDFVAMSMQVDQRNDLLYVGSGDETIRVWDLERGVQVGEANKTGLNTSFAVSSDGCWLLTGSSDSKIRGLLWELDPKGESSPKLVHRLMGKPGQEGVSSYSISSDSRLLFTGDDFGIGLLWDRETGQQIGEPIVNVRGSRINDAVFGSDGKSIFIAADNAAVAQIDLQKRIEGLRLEQLGYVVKLSMTEDEKYLLTVGELASETYIKTFATLWDLKSGMGKILDLTVTPRVRESDTVSRARITSAGFDPDRKVVLVSRTANENDKSEIRVWNLETLIRSNDFMSAQQMKQLVRMTKQSSNGGTVFVMPSVRGDTEGVLPLGNDRLLTMNNNGVFLWNLKTKREEQSYRAHAELTEADFSFDAKYVVTASRSVKIWDAVSGQALAKIESEKPIRTIQFSPHRAGKTGYVFATGGDDGVVKFWEFNPQTRVVKTFNGFAVDENVEGSKAIRRIRFSKDGDQLWIVGDEGLARLQHLRDAAKTMVLAVPAAQSLKCAAISDDGMYVAAGTSTKNVLVWQLPKAGRQLKLVTLSGHAGQVNDVGLVGSDADTLRVFSASQDGTTRVWDPRFAASEEGEQAAAGREIISLRRHDGDVTALDTNREGDLLMTAGSDGTVILWPAQPPTVNGLEQP